MVMLAGIDIDISSRNADCEADERDEEGEDASDEPNIDGAFFDAAGVLEVCVVVEILGLATKLDEGLGVGEGLARALGGGGGLVAHAETGGEARWATSRDGGEADGGGGRECEGECEMGGEGGEDHGD